jgi:hypothetical protein
LEAAWPGHPKPAAVGPVMCRAGGATFSHQGGNAMNKRLLAMGVVACLFSLGAITARGADPKTKSDGKAAKSEPVEKDGKIDGFTSKFDVTKANLTNLGANPYFIPLEPGYTLILKGGGATLTVTVTDKTKLVDGVETRVVEEREEKDGKPVEISQNFFAIDKNTKAVYYFGEDVDIYTDGKVTSHEGAWLSGVEGARFGLMMPEKPKVGDKFHQEIAPKVAYDRCEIAALDVELKTPSGTYKNCLRAKDGSAIESGTSEKLYAPGVGLVKDDEFVLEKIVKAGPDKKSPAGKSPK